MRVVHPLWRGFYLALFLAAARVLLGAVDALAPFAGDRAALALGGGLLLGAALAALPGRFRKGKQKANTSWQRCLRALICGAAMGWAYQLAGGGWVLPALMEGSAGAYAFAGMALAAGFVTVRIAERRREA